MEGVVRTYQHHNNRSASIVQVSTDTDFVARNKQFLTFVDNLLLHLVSENPSTLDEFLLQKFLLDDSLTVADYLKQQKMKFKEDITIVDFDVWSLDYE